MLKFLLVALLGISTASASIVFSNYTGTSNDSGLDVCGADCGGQSLALEFTPSANYNLTDVIVLLGSAGGGDDAVNIFLYSNSAGLPGSEIEQIGFDLSPVGEISPVTANSISSPITLVSGTSYWVVLLAADAGSDSYWSVGGSSSAPAAEESGANGWMAISVAQPWQTEVDGTSTTAAPEPASFLAIGCGLLLIRTVRFDEPKSPGDRT